MGQRSQRLLAGAWNDTRCGRPAVENNLMLEGFGTCGLSKPGHLKTIQRPWINMARYRRYNYNKWHGGTRPNRDAVRHMQERRALSAEVHGLDNQIISKLFKLSEAEVENLFQEYESAYGAVNGAYVRSAWSFWKSGKRGISGMNAKRFINLAPKLLSYDDRFELVSKLYEKTRCKEHHSLSVVLGINEAAFREIDDFFLRLSNIPLEHDWSPSIKQFVGWICDDDAVAAKALMTAIEAENSVMISRAAKVECERLRQSILGLGSAVAGTHRIELPCGTISLHIRKPTAIEKLKHFFK